MKTVEYRVNGKNKKSEFLDGTAVRFPGARRTEYIDSIEETVEDGKLIMKTLSRDDTGEKVFQNSYLMDLGKNDEFQITEFAAFGCLTEDSNCYQGKLERLKSFEREIN